MSGVEPFFFKEDSVRGNVQVGRLPNSGAAVSASVERGSNRGNDVATEDFGIIVESSKLIGILM